MSSKKRKAVNGALLSAAVTALAVKGTLAAPIGPAMQEPLGAVKKTVSDAREAALAESQPFVDGVQSRLLDSVNTGAQNVLQWNTGNASRSPEFRPTTTPSVKGSTAGSGATGSKRHANGPARMRNILAAAAIRHGIDPKLVLALAYWESGWDQTKVSVTGAVGLMQVEPATAQTAGPALLGRTVDINDPYDNAEVGVAVLREDLDNFKTPSMALAAYYQGPTSLEQNGMLPDTVQYVNGILDLAARLSA